MCHLVDDGDQGLQNHLDLTVPLASQESVGFLWSRIRTFILARENQSLLHQAPAREQWLPWT